jgi:hypothetical protein
LSDDEEVVEKQGVGADCSLCFPVGSAKAQGLLACLVWKEVIDAGFLIEKKR